LKESILNEYTFSNNHKINNGKHLKFDRWHRNNIKQIRDTWITENGTWITEVELLDKLRKGIIG
jgi:hypothetical protein